MSDLLPGIYSMPLEKYVNDPCPKPSLNSGTAYTLLNQSPAHAYVQHPRLNPSYEGEESSRLDLGTIAHAILLEGDNSRITVIAADNWRTKVAQEARDNARAQGKLPILLKDMDSVTAMVSVAAKAIANSQIADDWRDGVSEQTLIWEENGVWFRSRPDRHCKL